MRQTQASVTNFLYHGDDYLFLKRSPHVSINPNELNGIGGKVEPGENYVAAVIRETEEETGYKITPDDIQFCGIIIFEGGYQKDWISCFYKVRVPHKKIPLGHKIKEGELIWLHKDKVLKSQHKLVDDLNYIFDDIVVNDKHFFMNVEVGGPDLKIIKESTHKLKFPI